ncbi:MAG: dicarboxylate/amino acid:cation symporter [Proteobacteria bacterium]|nr:dicarboxylate/amino acid:cation symporter [Pseudomonadota bacterium]
MKRTIYINSSVDEIPEVQTKVKACLEKWKIRPNDIVNADHALKELLTKMFEASSEPQLKIEVHKLFGDCIIRITGRGTPLRDEDIPTGIAMPEISEIDSEQESIIRAILVKSYGRKVSFHNKKGLNIGTILVETSKQRALRRTLGALFGGIIFGIVIKAITDSGAIFIADNIFTPIYTMFLDAIKMLAAPLVFFSIAAAFATNGDIRRMGKLSARIMGGFVLTSLIAIGIAILGYYYLFPIGDSSLMGMVSNSANDIAETAANTSISLKKTIINIIPVDCLSPFLKSDMLKVLFLAVLTGIGVTKLGASGSAVTHGIDLLNELFLKITKIVIKFMPLSIFCAMSNMIIKTDTSSLVSVAQWMMANIACYAAMLVIYALMIPIFTKLNPIRFYKKYAPVMLNAFVICSGNAVMPFNMEICRTKLGISPKAYSFAIPFGTVMNKNGGCIVLMISTLFMAAIFGVTIEPSMLLSLVLMVYILSIAAPAIPGSLLICIAMILPMLGIPANAISIIIGIYALDAMVQTVLNVTGTAVCTLMAAKSENMIDMEVWNED